MHRFIRIAVMLGLALTTQIGAARAERRVALVVGNGSYEMPRMGLTNPPKDARVIAAVLTELGFEVETAVDASKEAMEDAVARLGERSRDADVTLFYYAGHGLQDLGKNYLMPVDATLRNETDLRRRFVRLDDVLGDLSNARGARIVILDACRDNEAVEALRAAVPRTRSTGVSRGLAPVPRVSGMLVAFATQPDRVAADGPVGNSPFTQALAARLVEPGVELRVALTRVRIDVARATANQQLPEVSDSLLGELYLREAAPAPASPRVDGGRQVDLAAETAFWASVERSGAKSMYEAYRKRFGESGFYSALAQERIVEIERAERAEAARRSEEAARLKAATTTLAPIPPADRVPGPQALLTPPNTAAPAAAPPPDAFTRRAQAALNKLGCRAGAPNGEWDADSRIALAKFKRFAKLTLPGDEPSAELIDLLESRDGRVCPPLCGPREQLKDGECVAKESPAPRAVPRKPEPPREVRRPDPEPPREARRPDPDPPRARREPPPRRPATVQRSGGSCFTFNGRQVCE